MIARRPASVSRARSASGTPGGNARKGAKKTLFSGAATTWVVIVTS